MRGYLWFRERLGFSCFEKQGLSKEKAFLSAFFSVSHNFQVLLMKHDKYAHPLFIFKYNSSLFLFNSHFYNSF